MSVQLNPTTPIQSVKTTQTAQQPARDPKATWQDTKTGEWMTEDQLQLKFKHEKRTELLVGLGTIGGMIGGTALMLARHDIPGMALGMGVMGAGLLLPRIAKGKDIGSGVVAFVGGGASIGIGAAVGIATKNPLLGGLAAGAAVLGTIALSKALKE